MPVCKHEALPRRLLPMLATSAAPFDDPAYFFETKWDGVRALASVDMGRWRLWGRAGSTHNASPLFSVPATGLFQEQLMKSLLILVHLPIVALAALGLIWLERTGRFPVELPGVLRWLGSYSLAANFVLAYLVCLTVWLIFSAGDDDSSHGTD